ncbi:replication initiator protein [Capybara microvirus Cap3_SP_588]|nr:replication initiator protein [Capybara microvirus Cap3_SP_588]
MCLNPKKAYLMNYKKDNNKNVILFNKPIYQDWHKIKREIYIPCGICKECKMSHAFDWVVRCTAESLCYENNYFVTLTYDNDKIPMTPYFGDDDSCFMIPTLRYKDVQDFFKRLRSKLDYNDNGNVRHFTCSEYGGITQRPHYHSILFGINLTDLKYYKKTENGDILYTSKLLSDCWQNGFVIVGEVTPESIAYVSRYSLKKQVDETYSSYHLSDFRESPKLYMSRRPGIGAPYYEKHQIHNKWQKLYLNSDLKDIDYPKYFLSMLEINDEELYIDYMNNKDKINEIKANAYYPDEKTESYRLEVQARKYKFDNGYLSIRNEV